MQPSAIASVITVVLILVILSEVTVPVNAKNVCAYKQHPLTRSLSRSGDNEQEEEEGIIAGFPQRQEVCPDGQDACFTLWREEAPLTTQDVVTSSPTGLQSNHSRESPAPRVIVIIAQGCWNPVGYECPYSECTWDKDLSSSISKVNGSSRFCCCRGSGCNRQLRPMPKNSLVRYDTGDHHEGQHYATGGAAIEPASSSSSSMVMTTTATAAAGTGDRIFLPVILCITLICLTLLLVYVAVILFRIREFNDYSEYSDVGECERLSKKNKGGSHGMDSKRQGWWPFLLKSRGSNNPPDPVLSCPTSGQGTSTSASFHIPPTPVIPAEALKVDRLVSNGRFGSIYKGSIVGVGENWSDERDETAAAEVAVAIKVYNVIHRQVLQKEKEVYRLLSTTGRQHPSIPVWFGRIQRRNEEEDNDQDHDDDDPESLTELGLVISFAPGGRLDSFLAENCMDWVTFCHMSLSIASGVAFLHSNGIRVSSGSSSSLPAHHVRNGCIVHRDLSSKNILIKADMSCMICDFGSALILTHDPGSRSHNQEDQGPPSLAPTSCDSLRYLAPEILLHASTSKMDSCSWKQVDVYALSLILWELATRCSDLYQGLPVPAYRKPYEQEVGSPVVTLEQMQIIVTKRKSRPLLADVWKESNPAIKSLRETITDSWDQDADARLTSVCMEERLSQLPILWERHRQEQRLLLLQSLTVKTGLTMDHQPHQHPATLFNLRNNHSSGHLNDLTVVNGDAPSNYQMNLMANHALVTGEKNVNLSSSPHGLHGASSHASVTVISFPIQPFLGRNPCLQRNLNPVRASDPESFESPPLEHTLKFNPVIRSAITNNNNWPVTAAGEDTGGRINSEQNVYPARTAGRRADQPRRHQRMPPLPVSRPGPIPEAIHNVCLLPKQQNHHLQAMQQLQPGLAPSSSSHSTAGPADHHMSQSSLARRIMYWATRRLSYPRLHVNSHLLSEESEPLSNEEGKMRNVTAKDPLPHVQQRWQQNHHSSDETIVVIGDGSENEDANVIHDKGTAPKGV